MTTEQLERASAAAPRPELDWERDGQGRPRILPDPTWDEERRRTWQGDRANQEGGVEYTRVTTFAEALQDSSALTRWKMRRAVLGMGRRPDYVTVAASLTAEDRDKAALDDLAEKALEASGPNAADVGTALHAFTERLDRGEDTGAVPEQYARTVDAYRQVVQHLRFVQYECRTVCDELETAGTPDRLGFCDVPDPDGVVDDLRIIDTKTGRVDYSAGKFATQLAIYAHSDLYHPGTGARTSWQQLHGQSVSRWGLIVHAPAGAGFAELLWLDLDHGWRGAQLCKLARAWRTEAKPGSLLRPVFARPPRPRPVDGTCRGRKQDGQPCGYRRKARATDVLAQQFCGRHGEQAAQLGRWLAENPGADPDGGVESAPSRDPVQPAIVLEQLADAAADAADRAAAAASRNVAAALARRDRVLDGERCDTTGLLVSACACDAHRGGMTPEEEAAAQRDDEGDEAALHEDAPVPLRELPPVPAGHPHGQLAEEHRAQTAAAAYEASSGQYGTPLGTYALDPATEVNGNPRPVSGLQQPADVQRAALRALVTVQAQLMAARSMSELEVIYTQHAADWTPQLTHVANGRQRELEEEAARARPEAALLAALQTAPDQATLTRLWSQFPRELWTAEAHVLARTRWEQLQNMAQL